MTTRDEWVAAFAEAAGVDVPTAEEVDAILELAGVAAHASERTAAPVTAWLASKAGLSAQAALDLAHTIE